MSLFTVYESPLLTHFVYWWEFQLLKITLKMGKILYESVYCIRVSTPITSVRTSAYTNLCLYEPPLIRTSAYTNLRLYESPLHQKSECKL